MKVSVLLTTSKVVTIDVSEKRREAIEQLVSIAVDGIAIDDFEKAAEVVLDWDGVLNPLNFEITYIDIPPAKNERIKTDAKTDE
jgi:hypothetical protein